MSDVRDQLVAAVVEEWGIARENEDVASMADAILERFDVTPKPVVTEEDLGRWVTLANGTQSHYGRIEHVGRRMFSELSLHGLKIVRVDDES